MGVQFIRRPADGSLPFINANGFDIVEVARTLKRFSTIANGGDIADSIRLNPVQFGYLKGVLPGLDNSSELQFISDAEILPTEGALYIGNKLLAIIKNLSLPFTPPEQDKLAIEQQNTLVYAQSLKDEAAMLKSIAESLENRAKSLLS